MNVDAIRSRVCATLSPDVNVRRAAELELKSVRLLCAFCPASAVTPPHR